MRKLAETLHDADGRVIQSDNQGRVLTKTFYASQAAYQAGTIGDQTTYAYDIYDSAGRHDTVTDSTGTTDTLYDVEGRVIRVTSPQGVINYGYDPATGEHIETSTANSDIKYSYDQEQRLSTVTVVEQNGVTLSSPEVTTYGYDLNNNLITTQLPNGVTTTDTYDALDRLTKEVNDNALGQLLAEYDYALLANGMRSSVKETELAANGTDSTRTFDWVYDGLGRLTEEQLTSSLAGESYTDDYTYNLVGDRVELKGTAANGTVTDTKSTYNALDQLTQDNTTVSGSSTTTTTNYTYDDNGSLISNITVGGDSYQYTYSVRNELASATISRTEQGHAVTINSNYKYDDNGIRVETDETTSVDGATPTSQTQLFLINALNPSGFQQVLEELASAGARPTMSYVPGLQLISQTTGAGSPQFFVADAQHSTGQLLDAAGSILAAYAYDAYGVLLGTPPGLLNEPLTTVLYDAQQWDLALEQYYLRARYYDPSSGDFTQTDPVAAAALDPQSLNRYLYVQASPTGHIDPAGTSLISTMVSIGSNLLTGLNFASNVLIAGRFGYRIGGLLYRLLLADEKIELDEAGAEAWSITKELGAELAMNYMLNFGSLRAGATIARKPGERGLLRVYEIVQINSRLAEHYIGNKYFMIRNTAVTIAGHIPDFINANVIREIKDVIRLTISGRVGRQLRAFAQDAADTGRNFFIHVRPGTVVSRKVIKMLQTTFGPNTRGVRWDIIRDVPEALRVVR